MNRICEARASEETAPEAREAAVALATAMQRNEGGGLDSRSQPKASFMNTL